MDPRLYMFYFCNNERCSACRIQVKWTNTEKKATNHPSIYYPDVTDYLWSTYVSGIYIYIKKGERWRDRRFYKHGGNTQFNSAIGRCCKEAVCPQSRPPHLFSNLLEGLVRGKGTLMLEPLKPPNSDKVDKKMSWLNYRSSLIYDEVASQ